MVSPWMLVLMGLVMVMVVATALAIRPGESTPSAWLAGGWGALYLACGFGLATSWRGFRTRPPPFLQERFASGPRRPPAFATSGTPGPQRRNPSSRMRGGEVTKG